MERINNGVLVYTLHVGTSWQFPAARSLRSSSATRVSGMRHRPMSRMPKPCEHQRLTDDSLVGRPALVRRVAVSDGEIVLFGMAPVSSMPNRAGVSARRRRSCLHKRTGGRLTDPAPIVIASPPRG